MFKIVKIIGRIIVLTIAMIILFTIGSMFVNVGDATLSPEESNMAGLALLVVCLIDTLLLVYLIGRANLYGWPLVAAVAIIYYVVKTGLAQIETWYFMDNISAEMLPGLFLMTVPVTLLFSPLAVWVWGKFKPNPEEPAITDQLHLTTAEWVWKTALLAILIYPFLYFTFGYYIAWQNPELRAFYGGGELEPFITHLGNTLSNTPTLWLLQIIRGVVWIGLAVLIMRTVKGGRWEKAIVTGLLFALLMNDGHLIPNPLMPPSVRLSHFIETASSNFIWGLVIVGLLTWHTAPTQEKSTKPVIKGT